MQKHGIKPLQVLKHIMWEEKCTGTTQLVKDKSNAFATVFTGTSNSTAHSKTNAAPPWIFLFHILFVNPPQHRKETTRKFQLHKTLDVWFYYKSLTIAVCTSSLAMIRMSAHMPSHTHMYSNTCTLSLSLSLSFSPGLSLSHTHTHTHTHIHRLHEN